MPYSITSPINIIGSLYGSLEDLMLIIDKIGYPPF